MSSARVRHLGLIANEHAGVQVLSLGECYCASFAAPASFSSHPRQPAMSPASHTDENCITVIISPADRGIAKLSSTGNGIASTTVAATTPAAIVSEGIREPR